jgi:hypothetical protein
MRNVPPIRPPANAFNYTKSQHKPTDLENLTIVAMDRPMIERVRDLQREIVLIEQDTRAYFGCRKPSTERTLLQQRRVERLIEIKNELGRLLQKSAA